MANRENRDGPFDLKPSEMIQIMETMGVNISRQQAVAISSWAYEAFRSWRIDNLPKPPIGAWLRGIDISDDHNFDAGEDR